jgi:hypothetical protein
VAMANDAAMGHGLQAEGARGGGGGGGVSSCCRPMYIVMAVVMEGAADTVACGPSRGSGETAVSTSFCMTQAKVVIGPHGKTTHT